MPSTINWLREWYLATIGNHEAHAELLDLRHEAFMGNVRRTMS